MEVPRDAQARDQFFRQMVPSFPTEEKVIVDAMTAVLEKSGDAILVTHSAGGGPGWATAIQSDKVKAIIALEPGAFPFPEGEVPPVEETTSPFPAVPTEIPLADFEKLIKIPIIVYFGDNVYTGDQPFTNWGFDNWRTRVNLAIKWLQVAKAHGGNVEVRYLSDDGATGTTHFMMADSNNLEVADAMENWLKSKGLAK